MSDHPTVAVAFPTRSAVRRRRVLRLVSLAVQLALLIAAQLDISRRSSAQIRGRKVWWRLAAFVNFVGPVSYFLFGRVRPTPPAPA